jgi:3-oxoacyl-(acyl-carrier-protein) synthase
VVDIEKEGSRQEKDVLATYGMLEGAGARISPLRLALAVWRLTGDDVGVLSIHGTRTGANVSYTLLLAESLLKIFNRRKMRLKSGTISSHLWHVLLATQWLRKVYCGTQKEDRLHGR